MAESSKKIFIHPKALVESRSIGKGTRVWGFTHVMKGARIGNNCNIGEHCYVESGVVVGDHVTVKNGVALWEGVTVEDGAFIGPFAVFTNDLRPRSMPGFKTPREEFLPTRIARGATIGANATIVCGVKVGEWAFVAAGAVVTRDVEPHALVAGNPAERIGYVCRCNRRITPGKDCACGARYVLNRGKVRIVREPVTPPPETPPKTAGRWRPERPVSGGGVRARR